MLPRIGVLALAALVIGLLVAPRLALRTSQHGALALPASSSGADPDAAARDRELVEIDAMPRKSGPELLACIGRWRALAERAAGSGHASYARHRIEALEEELEMAAAKAQSRLWRKVNSLEAAGRFDDAHAAIDRFVAGHAGTEVARQLARHHVMLTERSKRVVIADHSARFSGGRRQRSGLTVSKTEHVREHPVGLLLQQNGRSVVELTFELPSVPAHVDLHLALVGALTEGLVHCPMRVTINGLLLLDGWGPLEHDEQSYRWPIQAYVQPGRNVLRVSLHATARTSLFIGAARVVAYR